MKRAAPPDPILAVLMKKGADAPDDSDAAPDEREDPSLVAAEELAVALRRGDPTAIRDAFQTMLECCSTPQDTDDDRKGYALGGAVRPHLPRVPGGFRR